MSPQLHHARFSELDLGTMYDLLALRSQVFVEEQGSVYRDVDGRDREPGAEHWWYSEEGRVVAVLRVLAEPDGSTRIGRVCTHPDARGRGLAAQLVTAAGAGRTGDLVLAAQSQLRGWYERLGYEVDGPPIDDAGIEHLPMRRRATPG
ncbi:MAG: GCN5-related N-acetyltransferase [Thermoleophilia bacterium]|nr:GCN5-related N-acetyltransferase [Thermoleophilia bacterium]